MGFLYREKKTGFGVRVFCIRSHTNYILGLHHRPVRPAVGVLYSTVWFFRYRPARLFRGHGDWPRDCEAVFYVSLS